MNKYECQVCGHVYDPAEGCPGAKVNAGTAWEQVPADFACPDCGAGKDAFEAQG